MSKLPYLGFDDLPKPPSLEPEAQWCDAFCRMREQMCSAERALSICEAAAGIEEAGELVARVGKDWVRPARPGQHEYGWHAGPPLPPPDPHRHESEPGLIGAAACMSAGYYLSMLRR